MTAEIKDGFSLTQIAESGQCFRWEKTGDSAYRIIHRGHCLRIRQLDETHYRLDCSKRDYERVWIPYFDLREDYAAIRERIQRGDRFLREAAACQKGVRVLRQDPWEMLITSIITQNRNIPAIRRSVDLLCRRYGEKKTDRRGEPFYVFPLPEKLAAAREQGLKACGLGYRWAYVKAAAKSVASGGIDLAALEHAPLAEALEELTALYGVGEKVACCAALFGLHQTDAFPRDVWINRVLESEYPGSYPYEAYSPYNGIYQQYMFAYCQERSKRERNKNQRDADPGENEDSVRASGI